MQPLSEREADGDVTPQMIEGGVQAFVLWNEGDGSAERLVKLVYLAMRSIGEVSQSSKVDA